jgi:ketosteroid isomerase-like protein
MSQENVETARRWLKAVASVDFDAALALVRSDIEFVPPGDQPAYRGTESIRRWMEPDAFVEQVIEPLDFTVARDGRLLGRQHIRARGAASGIEMDIITWSVWTFDESGLITRIEVFLPHEEARARKAAGLSE